MLKRCPKRRKIGATIEPSSSTPACATPLVSTQPSTPIAYLGSIFKELAFKQYWNRSAADWSSKLWLPAEATCVASRTNYSSPFATSTACPSWFSVKTLRLATNAQTAAQSPLSSSPGIVDGARRYTAACETIKESVRKKRRNGRAFHGVGNKAAKAKGPLVTRKIRLRPTAEQAAVLRQFSNAHRWTYNQCVASQKEQKRGISIKKLRAKHVNKGAAPHVGRGHTVRHTRRWRARLQEGNGE